MTLSTTSLARACSRHPGLTLAAWFVVLLASITAVALVLTGFTTEANVTNNPESQRAEDRLLAGFPPDPGREVSDLVIVRSSDLTIDDDEFRAFAEGLKREILETGIVGNAQTYVDVDDGSLVSVDRQATLMPVNIINADDAGDIIDVVERADADPEFAVTITGDMTRDYGFNELSVRDLKEGELQFGLPAALLILLLVFGTVVAGLVPLLMAVVAIVTALGLVALLTQLFELSIFTTNMLTAMGLALGIDYALFVISRYREERGRGRAPDEAILTTGATASRAVLFSGSAFVIAMFGLLIVPSTIFRSLAAGAILVGITSLAVALTLLPALLGLLKDRVDSVRVPIVGRRSVGGSNPEGRIWGAIIDRVVRRPAVSLAISSAALVAIALPAFGLGIGTAGVSTLPDDMAAKQGYVALQRDFPDQTVNPVHVVVTNYSDSVSPALEQLSDQLAADPRFGPGEIRVGGDDVAELVVPVRGDPTGGEAIAAVRDLREQIVPAAFERTNADPLVGGTTSETVDYLDSVTNPVPLVFAFVLGLSLVLLTIAFRSVVIAHHGDSAQSALGRGHVWPARARLPVRRGCGTSRFPNHEHDRGMGPPLPLLRTLRPLNGLPGLSAQPHPRTLRPGRRHRRSRPVGRRIHRPNHHRCGADHRRGLRRLRPRRPGDVSADGLRHCRRATARRHCHPLRRATKRNGPAQQPQLVPPQLAAVDAPPRSRRKRFAGGSECGTCHYRARSVALLRWRW